MATLDDILASLELIKGATDPQDVMDMVDVLTTDITTTLADQETIQQSNTNLLAENTRLKEKNRDLFLQITAQEPDELDEPDETNEQKPKKYEDLFNEEGGLF